MPDNLHSAYEFEEVHLGFVSRSMVGSLSDKRFSIKVSPEQALEILQAHLTTHAADVRNAGAKNCKKNRDMPNLQR